MDTIIRNKHELTVQMVHPELITCPEKYLFPYGGRGGGKSKTMARVVPSIAWENPGFKFLITRKAMPSLRVTAMKDTLDAIEQMGIPGHFYKADSYFQYVNGSIIYFFPLYVSEGRNERLKSMDLNGIWFEEATEITLKDFDTIRWTVRLPGMQKFWFSFNPPESSDHWLYKLFDRQNSKGNARKIHFGIEENPLLPDDIKRELEALREVDEGLWKRYCKGEWGIDVKRKRVWDNVQSGMMEGEAVLWGGGADFGWSSPGSFHLYGVKESDIYAAEVYMVAEVYETRLQPEDFACKIWDTIIEHGLSPKNVPIVADSEAPEKIEKMRYFKHHGQWCKLWVIPAKKERGSRLASIDEVRRYQVIIDENNCPNGHREVTNWVYPEDRDGNIREDPLKINDHSCDDLRYFIYTFLRNRVIRSITDKSREVITRSYTREVDTGTLAEFDSDLKDIM